MASSREPAAVFCQYKNAINMLVLHGEPPNEKKLKDLLHCFKNNVFLVFQDFRRLVLGCMDSYDSESRRIFQLCFFLIDLPNELPKSKKFCKLSHHFSNFQSIFAEMCKFSFKSAIFRRNFSRNFPGISQNATSKELHKIPELCKKSRHFVKFGCKRMQNCENSAKNKSI